VGRAACPPAADAHDHLGLLPGDDLLARERQSAHRLGLAGAALPRRRFPDDRHGLRGRDLGRRAFKVPAGTARRTFAFSAGVNNFGYLGIPVTAALFNHDVVGVLLVHNVGVEAAVWTVGIAMLSGESLRKGLKKLFQPMTVALFVALAINLAGFGKSADRLRRRSLHAIGECAIPIGTLLTGIYLPTRSSRTSAWPPTLRSRSG
jgi:predicted permease